MEEKRCATPYCLNSPVKHRTLCHKCRSKQYRDKNKLKATYQIMKDNAKRRNIEFSITLPEFKQFCTDTGYLEIKGTEAESGTVDRIDPRYGYTLNNIQVLTLSENVKKKKKDNKKTGWSKPNFDVISDIDVPF
jgi:hypothetical protein